MEVTGLGQQSSDPTRSSGDFSSSHLLAQSDAVETSSLRAGALGALALITVYVNY